MENSEGCGGVNIRHLFCRVNFVEGNSKSRGCILVNFKSIGTADPLLAPRIRPAVPIFLKLTSSDECSSLCRGNDELGYGYVPEFSEYWSFKT